MKRTRTALLMSVAAAALMAGAGIVSAQSPLPAPAAQQSAPAEKTAPMQKPKDAAQIKMPEAGVKAAEEKMAPKEGKAQRAQDDRKDGMKPKSADTKSLGKTSSEMKADGKPAADIKAETKPTANQTPGAQAPEKSTEKTGDAKASTTGQGAAAGSAAAGPASLSGEQRSAIRGSVRHAQPATNINFSISIGTAVPRTVRFYPMTSEIVVIYPHYRGFQYFLVGDQIIVVDPRTHQIVAVLEA